MVAVRSLRSPNKPFFASQLQPVIDMCTVGAQHQDDVIRVFSSHCRLCSAQVGKGVVWATMLSDKRQAAQRNQLSQVRLTVETAA